MVALVVGSLVTTSTPSLPAKSCAVNEEIQSKPNRRKDIDAAKGLAIILVVFGHVVARDIPSSGEWYGIVKSLVYTFHMPLFIFLNGFVFGLSWQDKSALSEQLNRSWFRASRLIPPFLAMGLIIFLGKYIAAQYIAVDNPVIGLASITDLVLQPTASFSSFLWYLYVLSLIFMAFPLLYRLSSCRFVILLAISASLYLLPSSNLFAWIRIQELLFFFVFGVFCTRHIKEFNELIGKYWWIFGILLGAAWATGIYTKLICGLLAIPFVMGLVGKSIWQNSKALIWIGSFTLSIYLLNTIFIGISKAVLSRFFNWDGPLFLLFFCVLLFSGIVFPILTKQLILRRNPILDKYTG